MTTDSWMDPPKVPATRPCPTCGGTKQVEHPKFFPAWALVEKALRPAMESAQAMIGALATDVVKPFDWEAEAHKRLEEDYPPLPCPQCKATGEIRMEQPGDVVTTRKLR